jgi:hypothetical protein
MIRSLHNIAVLRRMSLVLLAVVLLIAACGNPGVTGTESVNEYACRQGGSMGKIPAVPEGVLLQSLLIDPHGREGGYRIYSDGRYESRPLGESWTFGSPLTPNQMEAVRAAISEAGLDTLEPLYQPAQPLPDQDGNVLWFQVADDGSAVRTIKIVRPCKVSEIETLSNRLVTIFKGK